MIRTQRLSRLVILLAVMHTPGCVSTREGIWARGVFERQSWITQVDHPVARDYLEGRPLPVDLEAIRRKYVAGGLLPSEPALSYLTDHYSPDVATLFFAEALSAHSPSRFIQEEYARAVHRLKHTGEIAEVALSSSRLTVAFAPGWFYKSQGAETGADFHEQLEQLEHVGVPGELIETDENGTVESNAKIIADVLRRLQSEGREVILVSGSKSGAEVAIALGEVLGVEETRGIRAWLSIGGVHKGSPFADWTLNPAVCWIAELYLGLQGFALDGARSLQTSHLRPQFASLRFPEHLLLVSYVAVPLSGDISDRGAFGYSRMRHIGPNDGLTLLLDELLPGGLTIIEPGVDHFFEHPDRELRSLALLEVLLTRLGATKELTD